MSLKDIKKITDYCCAISLFTKTSLQRLTANFMGQSNVFEFFEIRVRIYRGTYLSMVSIPSVIFMIHIVNFH